MCYESRSGRAKLTQIKLEVAAAPESALSYRAWMESHAQPYSKSPCWG